MIEEKSWKEFQETGLLVVINQILHIFGWALAYTFDTETGEILRFYPARVKFRGFNEKSATEAYKKVSKYMLDNSEELYKETMRD